MVFLCGRPGCGRESSATLQIDAPASTVTLVDPRVSRDGVPLCPHHADATTPPMGWTMNDLRSMNRTLAPVRPIGPRTGDTAVGSPRPRPVGNPLFQDSRPSSTLDDRLPLAEIEPEPDPSPLSFPVSNDVRSMPVSASRTAPEPEAEEADEIDLRDRPRAAAGPAGNGAKVPKAPASRPSKRRDVVEEAEAEEEKFPWHFSFKDDQPTELQAKTPLLARAFRSSVG